MESLLYTIFVILYTVCMLYLGIKIGDFKHMWDYDRGFLDAVNQMNNNQENNNED